MMKNKFLYLSISLVIFAIVTRTSAGEKSTLLTEDQLSLFIDHLVEEQEDDLLAVRSFFEVMENQNLENQKISVYFPIPSMLFSSSFAEAKQSEISKIHSGLDDLNKELSNFKKIANRYAQEDNHKVAEKSEIEGITVLAEKALALTKKAKAFLADIYGGRILVTSKDAIEVKRMSKDIQKNLQQTSFQVLLENRNKPGTFKKLAETTKEDVPKKLRQFSDYEKRIIEEFMQDDFSKIDQVKILSIKDAKAHCFRAGYILDQKDCKNLPSSFEWNKSWKVACPSDKPILCNPRIYGLTLGISGHKSEGSPEKSSICEASKASQRKMLMENNPCEFQPLCLSTDQKFTSKECRLLSEKNKSMTYWTAGFLFQNSEDSQKLKQMIRSLCYRPTKDHLHLDRMNFQDTEEALRDIKGVLNPSAQAKSLVDSCRHVHRQILELSHHRSGSDKSNPQILQPKDCKNGVCGEPQKPPKKEATTI